MGLYKAESGLVVFDDFENADLNTIWTVSPSNNGRYSLTDRVGYLRLKHGTNPIYLLMDIDNYNNLIFEIKNDYFPNSEGEAGGIYLAQSNSKNIKFYENYKTNTTNNLYEYLRIIKNGNLITAQVSNDAKIWENIGNDLILSDIHFSGVGLEGLIGSDYDIDWIRAYKSMSFEIVNLEPGMKVEWYDELNTLINTRIVQSEIYGVKFTSECFPVTGTFKFYDLQNNLIKASTVPNIWGGDVFLYGNALDIYKDGSPLTIFQEANLGSLNIDGSIVTKLQLVNNNVDTVTNIKLQISQYRDIFGYQWVELAPDILGESGEYSNILTVNQLTPGQSCDFWLKVERDELLIQPSMQQYQFLINMKFD